MCLAETSTIDAGAGPGRGLVLWVGKRPGHRWRPLRRVGSSCRMPVRCCHGMFYESYGSADPRRSCGIGDGPERKPFLRPGFDTARPVSRPLLRAVPEAMLRFPQNASWERHTVRTGRAGRPRILVAGGVGGISGNTPLTQRCTPVYSCGLPQKAALERAF